MTRATRQGVEYERRMNAKADALAAANRAMVAANNAYVLDPNDKKLAKAHADACEALIRAVRRRRRRAFVVKGRKRITNARRGVAAAG